MYSIEAKTLLVDVTEIRVLFVRQILERELRPLCLVYRSGTLLLICLAENSVQQRRRDNAYYIAMEIVSHDIARRYENLPNNQTKPQSWVVPFFVCDHTSCGPTMFPTQYATKIVAAMKLFFVWPATLDMPIVMMRLTVPPKNPVME